MFVVRQKGYFFPKTILNWCLFFISKKEKQVAQVCSTFIHSLQCPFKLYESLNGH
jgi:hypothetical protein